MKKADFIIIAVVLAVAGALLFFLYAVNDNYGACVQIEVDGKVTETLPIDTDTTKVIVSENGGENTLVIKDGSAKMTQADCPDGICVSHKSINRNGESIICLPHKVVVTVIDKNDSDEIDAVA